MSEPSSSRTDQLARKILAAGDPARVGPETFLGVNVAEAIYAKSFDSRRVATDLLCRAVRVLPSVSSPLNLPSLARGVRLWVQPPEPCIATPRPFTRNTRPTLERDTTLAARPRLRRRPPRSSTREHHIPILDVIPTRPAPGHTPTIGAATVPSVPVDRAHLRHVMRVRGRCGTAW